MKTSLFGLIALLVLTVSVSSTFETAYAEGEDPIQIVLDITHQNILDSLEDAGINPENDPYYTEAKLQYDAAIAALNSDDPNIVDAKNSALIAMALFEKSAEEIGFLEGQVSTQIPPGLNTAVTNLFEVQERITGIDEEVNELRGLIKLNNFDDIDFTEFDESVNLAKTLLADGIVPDAQAQLELANQIKNALYDKIDAAIEEAQDERVEQFAENSIKDIESILEKAENLGLTKQVIDELQDTLDVLKSGDIDDIIEKTSEDSEFAKQVEGNDNVSKEFEDDGPGNSENAPGQSDDDGPGNSENAPGQSDEGGPGNSENAPGQSDEGGPGNSENAPGQNKGNDEAELPPGFDSASDTGKANGNGKGLGLGKEAIPPGLAKLFGYDDGTGNNKDFEAPEGLPPGFGAAIDSASDTGKANGIGLGLGGENIPPGQLKKLDYAEFGTYSPDDYFEDATEDLREDSFEDNYDKMYKNSKAKEKKDKIAAELIGKANAKGNSGGGNPNCDDEGVTDNDPTNTSGTVNVPYVVEDFTAVGSSCADADPDQINIQVTATIGPPPFLVNINQGESFTPTEPGTYIISASFQGQFETREVVVPGANQPPTNVVASAGAKTTPASPPGIPFPFVTDDTQDVGLVGTIATDPDGDDALLVYTWGVTGNPSSLPTITDNDTSEPSALFNAPEISGGGPDRDYVFTLTVTDEGGAQTTSQITITITND